MYATTTSIGVLPREMAQNDSQKWTISGTTTWQASGGPRAGTAGLRRTDGPEGHRRGERSLFRGEEVTGTGQPPTYDHTVLVTDDGK